MKKQIEEMVKIMCHGCFRKCDDTSGCIVEDYAEDIYTAGYRKQIKGEWVKVYQNKIATVYECSCCKHLSFGTSDYCICGANMKGAEDGKAD